MPHILDVIGPIMIGPSSSHTAGAARIGKLALLILQEPLREAKITLYGSFSDTYMGHGTHLALLGGLLGFEPDDPRIRQAEELARDAFRHTLLKGTLKSSMHPNTVRLSLKGDNGGSVEVLGVSVGGGRVRIVEIDGFQVLLDGEGIVLVVHSVDKPGVITQLTSSLAYSGINIGNMSVSREARGASVIMTVEADAEVDAITMDKLRRTEGINKLTQIVPR